MTTDVDQKLLDMGGSGRWTSAFKQLRAYLSDADGDQNGDAIAELSGVLQHLLENEPLPRTTFLQIARVAAKLGQHELEAFALSRAAADGRLAWPLYSRLMGLTLDTKPEARRPDALLQALEVATDLYPDEPSAWRELGVHRRRLGLAHGSLAAFKRVLQLDPDDHLALRLLAQEHAFRAGDNEFQVVAAALAKVGGDAPGSRADVHYAAAKAFDDLGDIDAAFENYSKACQLVKSSIQWSPAKVNRLVSALVGHATQQNCGLLRREGHASERPVFVVGMPRSGTTLVAQLIASHPHASTVGELSAAELVLNGIRVGGEAFETTREDDALPFAVAQKLRPSQRGSHYLQKIEALAGSHSVRVVDKMPANYMWAGLIEAILPGARFIHCQRHPIATCWSQYKTHFGAAVPFSYDFDDLGQAYRAYVEIMRHWSTVLPADRILHVRYERLIDDFEYEARRIIRFLGLPWTPSCLDFHLSRGEVRTASALQVRRPIYRDALTDWRRFERHFTPLLSSLESCTADYERA